MSVVVWDTFGLPVWRAQHVSSTSRLHVSDRSISEREFARFQRRSYDRDLCDLVRQCADRFRYAHQLLKCGAPLPDWCERRSAPDLSSFYMPWDMLCAHYREHMFDPQIDLFEHQDAREHARWSAFRQEKLFAAILQNPDFTWCALQQAGFLQPTAGAKRRTIESIFSQIMDQVFA